VAACIDRNAQEVDGPARSWVVVYCLVAVNVELQLPVITPSRMTVRPPSVAKTLLGGGVRIHDLRDTCVSIAISAGANVKVVQKLLGHKTAVLTLDRYGHRFPDDLDAVAVAFDAAAATTADDLRTTGNLKLVASDEKTL
jgi:hypothetical protein